MSGVSLLECLGECKILVCHAQLPPNTLSSFGTPSTLIVSQRQLDRLPELGTREVYLTDKPWASFLMDALTTLA